MGGMLTKGLGGPACCTLIVGFFRLKLECTITPVLPGIQYDGGSRPYAPGEIANLYKPVASHLQPLNKGVLPFMRPYHPPVPLDKITIKVIFKRDKKEEMGEGIEEVDNAYTREFMVPKSRTKIIVRAFNFMNVTQEKIQVAISNFRSIVTKIKVTITRFRKKP
jgi:hypothetical protein